MADQTTQTTAQPTSEAAPGTQQTQTQTQQTSTALTSAEQQTTTDPGAQGEKAKAETTAADIEIKVPEGVEVDKGLVDNFKAFAKENKLTSEAAQKFVDKYVTAQQGAVKAAQDRHVEQITQWAEEAKSDKEIGGQGWDANLSVAKKALQRFGNPELTEILNSTGLGNHKAVIRFFAQVGKSVSEDSMPKGQPSPAGGSGVDPLRAMYPSMFKD